ncbi:MAG: DUF2325 domain-containing protein [Hyphomicrobiales bacterium]|nr:DUF2325 domain-containing protein [Hyphomicrobiales bacterium]
MRRIIAKLQIPIPADAEEYSIHGFFAASAEKPAPVAKAMHKILERKYRAAIRRFSRLEDAQALLAAWDQCLEQGDVPGPYWALVTHPAACEDVTWRAFGHVHMLSHLVGSSNRADIRRLRQLEQEQDVLTDKLSNAKRDIAKRERDLRQLVEDHAAQLREFSGQCVASQELECRLSLAESRVQELEAGETHQTMLGLIEALNQMASEETKRADQAFMRLTEQSREIEDLRSANERLREELHMALRDCEAIEAEFHGGLGNPDEHACPVMDLCGRRIIYIGGRARLIPHLQALVERANGIFIHHDGGVEESYKRLGDVLSRGDAVLCPVDCISHGACQAAKRVCKQRSKAFVPLRSSGLSSFMNGLRTITIEAPAGDEINSVPPLKPN